MPVSTAVIVDPKTHRLGHNLIGAIPISTM